MTSSPLQAALHLPVNTVALRRGGLVRAVMHRANELARACPERAVVIEVLAFQPRLAEDVGGLVARGFLDPRVHVRSILSCLDPACPEPTDHDPVLGCVHHDAPDTRPGRPVPRTQGEDRRADPRTVVLDDPPLRSGPRLRRRRATLRVPTRTETGALRHVDVYIRSGERLRREEYAEGDRLARVLAYRPGDSRPVTHRWIGRDGSCFLAVWQNPESREWANAFAFTRSLVAMPNPKALYGLAFEQALSRELDPVLFSEFRDRLPNVPARGLDEVVERLRHPTLRRVAVVHSHHALVGEHTLPMASSPNFTALLERLGSWDLLVTATEHQRQDIAAQYGHPDRIRAIAHLAPDPPSGERRMAADPNRFVLVARIHRKKRVDEALRVFRLVLDQNPEARLEIFGFGYGDRLEKQTTALATELGLDANVTFAGFVDDPSEMYDGACATLQTSQSEGFGMALLESLLHGVPVVAYDVCYGTSEVIRNGVDGYTVPWGDRVAMAQRLLILSRDRELRAELAREGPLGAARFSRERYVREWENALSALPRRADAAARMDVVPDGRLNRT